MPRLLAPVNALSTSGPGQKRMRETTGTSHRQRGVTAPARPLTTTQMKQSSHALFHLWKRLRHTLLAAEHETMTDPTSLSLTDRHAGRNLVESPAVVNRAWQLGFGESSTTEDLFLHLLVHTEFFDRLSWLVALCLLDRVDFAHRVRQRLRGPCASGAAPSLATSLWSPSTLITEEYQRLFAAYCLAVKWHCDYSVTVPYLVNLLPHSKATRQLITTVTVKVERDMFELLDCNCTVTPAELCRVVQQYALPEEQQCLADLVPHLADGSERGLRAALLCTFDDDTAKAGRALH